MTPRILLALALTLSTPAQAQPAKQSLNVAAAANLKLAIQDMKAAFETEHPGVEVGLTLGASGNFFAQIQNGAPFDVFLSADRAYPLKIVQAGLAAPSDEKVYAFGKLVAWLPPGSKLDLESRGLSALTERGVTKIAMADPAVAPFGRATEAALKKAGVYEAVKSKIVMGTSVGQAAQFATSGAVEVAFLPYSLTFSTELKSGRSVPIAESLYPKVEQSGVVLKRAADPALARAFLDFVVGPSGRAILTRYGYGLP